MDYTTLNLINSIQRRASVPTSQSLFTSADLVAIMDEELRTSIIPLIMRMRESYLVDSVDVTIIPGTTEYVIPSQAIGMKLRDLSLIDSQGRVIGELPLITLEEIKSSMNVGFGIVFKTIFYRGYYIQNNTVVLYPDEKCSGTGLRMSYYRRPNTLCQTTDAGQIQSINTTNNEITLVSCPTTWTVGTAIDVISNNPGFDVELENQTISAINGFVITVPSVSGINIGDWVAATGYSPIPQIPPEGHLLLAQAATVKVLEALNDQTGLAAAQRKYAEMQSDFTVLIGPRIDGSPKKITAVSAIW